MPRQFQHGATQEEIDLAEQDYNNDVIEVNKLLKEGCEANPRLTFKSMRGLKQNWRNGLADGVHLTFNAMRTFFNNTRSAFVVEKNRIYA